VYCPLCVQEEAEDSTYEVRAALASVQAEHELLKVCGSRQAPWPSVAFFFAPPHPVSSPPVSLPLHCLGDGWSGLAPVPCFLF
jgi:hypothetical protein